MKASLEIRKAITWDGYGIFLCKDENDKFVEDPDTYHVLFEQYIAILLGWADPVEL